MFAFSSFNFLLFLVPALILYYLVPGKWKHIWLLAVSIIFYAGFDCYYLLWLIISIISTYSAGRILELEGFKTNKNRKILVLVVTLGINIGMLGAFKYTPSLILPVGMSFYIFQATGYLIDVYRGEDGEGKKKGIKAERSILKYALFVSFFPNIVSGPIERENHFMKQIDEMKDRRLWSYDGIINGIVTVLWGYFLKMVIADRMSLFVDHVYENISSYGTGVLILTMFAYSVQIYTDFAGYSLIAIGVSKMMGIELLDNFRTPYFARSISEFWDRWHISLSTWLRDYVYIPLGGSRCAKWRSYANLMITFLVSGAWHGVGLNYIVWGALHGLCQVIEKAIKGATEKSKESKPLSRLLAGIITFAVVSFLGIFFRADSMKSACDFIAGFARWDLADILHGKIHDVGFDKRDIAVLIGALPVALTVDVISFKKDINEQEVLYANKWLRYVIILLLAFAVILFGKYGQGFTQSFVYTQF